MTCRGLIIPGSTGWKRGREATPAQCEAGSHACTPKGRDGVLSDPLHTIPLPFTLCLYPATSLGSAQSAPMQEAFPEVLPASLGTWPGPCFFPGPWASGHPCVSHLCVPVPAQRCLGLGSASPVMRSGLGDIWREEREDAFPRLSEKQEATVRVAFRMVGLMPTDRVQWQRRCAELLDLI